MKQEVIWATAVWTASPRYQTCFRSGVLEGVSRALAIHWTSCRLIADTPEVGRDSRQWESRQGEWGKVVMGNRPQVLAFGLATIVVGANLGGCSSTPVVPPLVRPAAAPAPLGAAAPAAAGGATTLPQFLGIPQAFRGGIGLVRLIRDRLTARLGARFPGLEPRPPLKLLADPANLSEDAPPSVQAAAKIKQEQDAGAQKAKAAAFLATVGCGCYEGVAEALAENLRDCNEEVRFATAKALRDLGVRSCSCCGGNGCCTAEVQKELMRLAWEFDDNGCYVEKSQRVRRLARLALETCCQTVPGADESIPEEGPGDEDGQVLGVAQAVFRRPPGGAPTALADTVAHAARPLGSGVATVPARGRVLARVNGEAIHVADLNPGMEPRSTERPNRSRLGGGQAAPESQRLAEAIDRRLLAQAARRELPTDVRSSIEWQILSDAEDVGSGGDAADRPRRLEVALGREWLRRQIENEIRSESGQTGLDYASAAASVGISRSVAADVQAGWQTSVSRNLGSSESVAKWRAAEVACLERLRSQAVILVLSDPRSP